MAGNSGDGAWQDVYGPFMKHYKGFKNNPVNNSQTLNEMMYTRILTELSCNRFKWTGLPDTIDPRWMELSLFHMGLAVWYWDWEFERFLALRGSAAGPLDFYNNSIRFQVFGNQMINKTVYPWHPGKVYNEDGVFEGMQEYSPQHDPLKDCVPIWSNFMRIPDTDIVTLYSRKLANFDRTIEILGQNMRVTRIVAAAENERLSQANIMRQVEEGVPLVFVTDQFDMEKIQALDVGAHPDLLDRMQLGRTRLWNECMGLMGINNANQDKKERLVSDEVQANDEQVMSTRSIALESRKYAAAQINERWNMTIDVNFNVDLQTPPSIVNGAF